MVGEIGLSSRSRFDRGLRYSFFLIETLSITGQHFFKCLKNSSNRIQKGLLRRRQQGPSQVFAAGMPEKLNPSQLRRHTGGDNYQVADDFFLHIGQYPKQ